MGGTRAVPREAGLVLALIPAAVGVLLLVLAPAFVEPLFDPAVSIAGMPAGLVMLGLATILVGAGILMVSRARGPGAVAVGDAVAMLALVIVILGPAAILILKNLSSVTD